MLDDFLPDVLGVLGLVTLATGVAVQFGLAWALMVAGLVLLLTGVTAAWNRNR